MPSKWSDSIILICILVGAFFFRFYPNNSGITGLTFLRIDEVHYIQQVVGFLNGDWRVDYFTNPTLFSYILYGVTAALGGFSLLLNSYDSFQAFVISLCLNPHDLILTGRMISVFFSTASVALVYIIAKQLFGRPVAVTAAVALAFNFTHAQRAPLAGNESAMVFFVLLYFLSLMRYARSPSLSRHFICGFLLGLAGSLKYNALIQVIPFVVVSLLVVVNKKGLKHIYHPVLLLGFISIPIGFALGSPSVLLNTESFWNDFLAQRAYLHDGYVESDRLVGTLGYINYLLKFPFGNNGIVLTVFCGLGIIFSIVALFKKQTLALWMLLSAGLPLYLYLGSGIFGYMRFLLPAIPFILILGSWALVKTLRLCEYLITQHADHRFLRSKRFQMGVFAIVLCAVFLPSTLRNHHLMTQLYGTKDPKSEIMQWVMQNVKPQDRVLKLVLPWEEEFPNRCTAVAMARYEKSWKGQNANAHELEGPYTNMLDTDSFTNLLDRSSSLEELDHKICDAGYEHLLVVMRLKDYLEWEKVPLKYRKKNIISCPYWDDIPSYLAGFQVENCMPSEDGSLLMMYLDLSKGI